MPVNLSNLDVAVLAGGPDAEREVSIQSATAVAAALREGGKFAKITYLEIDCVSQTDLAQIEGDVFFPVLHGRWGEGGPLQEILENDGRPYVGCGPNAARLAVDKTASKETARLLGIPVADSYELDDFEGTEARLDLPLVVKPVDDGSSVNVFICQTTDDYQNAIQSLSKQFGPHPTPMARYMVERFIPGRELTVGIIGEAVSSVIEIIPNTDFYDYEAKYDRDDTRYVVDPELPESVCEAMCDWSLRLFREMGCRDLSRVDFRFDDEMNASKVDASQSCVFLEINTMPGFTAHSLVPMGARRTQQWEMPELCTRLVEFAVLRAKGRTA